jgi:hypothetical protein
MPRLHLLLLFSCLGSHLLAGQLLPVASEEQTAFLRRVIPLPREITFTNKIEVQRPEMVVRADLPDSPVTAQARLELVRGLGLTQAASDRPGFEIRLQLGGDASLPLRSLKNANQAYRILPQRENRGLDMIALDPVGLLYGVKTLGQLIRTRGVALEIPLVTVTDWPEMADRGLWGVDAFNCLPWLADRKLNYVEQIAAVQVDPATRRATARPKPGHEPLLELGPRLGIQFVPVVLHLEQLEGKGLFEAYPNLRGKGGGKPGVVCYSQPQFAEVLADWLVELARLPHVREVDVWLAENLAGKGGCRCEDCRKVDRSVLELRTVLRAWKLAQSRAGALGLRILTSEETYRSHNLLLPEIPPEVKLWYYHSLLTYTARKEPMIRGDIARLAQTQWVGVCPSLVAYVGFPQPFSSAPFMHYRMSEFADKKLQGIIGYPSPRVGFARFNLEAMAEWAWNPRGRSPREFARAFAARNGWPPETFADWAERHGEVSWDVYGSDWPAGEQRRIPGHVAELLLAGNLPPFGEVKWGLYGSPWGQIKSADQLERDVRASTQALQLARQLGAEEFLQETLVVDGYIHSLHALSNLRGLVRNGTVAADQKEAARKEFERYSAALNQARTALMAWERVVGGAEASSLVRKPVEKLEEMIQEMQTTAAAVLK